MIGRTISHYKITAKLGQGGMGTVYKAEDLKLKRPVALKFLAAHLLDDEEIRARFTREAEAAAGLNHPNICHVYEIDEVEGKTFISMAFVEGDGLDKKIEAGPLKFDDAIDIAIQTAKGLQAAHAKKVVHRDIKPANLMIGDDGRVTIMDFGLALLGDRSKLTRLEQTMGTVTYMSPEQTYGMELDHRTDIWSLGVVLYEMVTGQEPFKGHYDKAVMYSITNEEPEPMTALRTAVPMELEWLAGKCMAKDREQRYQHADEIIVDLQIQSDKLKSRESAIIRTGPATDIGPPAADVGARHAVPAGPATSDGERARPGGSLPSEGEGIEQALTPYRVIERLADEGDTVTYRAEDTQLHRSVAIKILPESDAQKAQTRERRRHLLSTAVSALAIALAAVFAFLWLNQSVPEAPLRRFSFTPENLSGGDALSGAHVAISPDGRRIVYVAGEGETKLWVRNLDQAEARELDGTEEARRPFWSPDSEFIGFVTETEVRKVSVRGGAPVTLCKLPHRVFGGGAWSPDGDLIVFSSDVPLRLFQVPARGGTPEILFDPEGSMGPHHWTPHFFPEASARSIAFAAGTPSASKIVVRDLQDQRNELIADGRWPYYSPGGHLLFERDNDLWALPFSVAALKATGEAFPVAQNAWRPSVARDGTLVYADAASEDQQLVWRSRAGDRLEVIGQPQRSMERPSLSPDGRQVAVQSRVSGNGDIWVHDIERGGATRITFNPAGDLEATWTPSGQQITYASFRGGFTEIFSASADGSGNEIQLTDEPVAEYAPNWSPDGKYLIYHTRGDPNTQRNLWYREIEPGGGTSDPVIFVQTRFNERVATFSPDGRLVAYCSDQSGQYEVYVRPFPQGGRVTKVSVNGGNQPRWGKNGKELLYVEGSTLMSVPVSDSGGFSAGLPRPLFDNAGLLAGAGLKPQYDVTDDGQKFVLVERVGDETAKPRSIHVVQNWFAEFRDRQPSP